MADPLTSTTLVAKTLLATRVAGAVTSGNDPSILAMTALAFPPVFANRSEEVTSGERILERKNLGELESSNPQMKESVAVEKYVDSKYFEHGNWDDAWTQLKGGGLTFDSFMRAMVDLIDALTLGVFKPKLLEIKINPHIKTRTIVYRAEVLYDTPETESFQTSDAGKKIDVETTVNRRITQVSKVTFEVNPEVFNNADISFAEGINNIERENLAERIIVYSRLDELTHEDWRSWAQNQTLDIQKVSQRLRTIESEQDLVTSGIRDIETIEKQGGVLVADDQEIQTSVYTETRGASLSEIKDEDLSRVRGHGEIIPKEIVEKKSKLEAIQEERIDHITGEHSIKSAMVETTTGQQEAESQGFKWVREGVRVRELQGTSDILTLESISPEEFLKSGATLLSDKERARDLIVAVDISNTGESVTLVSKKKKRSWLIKRKVRTHHRIESSEEQMWKLARQVTDYDYLSNSEDIIEASIELKKINIKRTWDVVETRKYWSGMERLLGEDIKKKTTPKVETSTELKEVTLSPSQNIVSEFGRSSQYRATQGTKLKNLASQTTTEELPTIEEHYFNEGKISWVPFVGGITSLASKVGLGANVTLSDAFWAAADVAEISLVVAAIAAAPASGGGSLAAAATVTAAKSAARTAAKSAARAAVKMAAKNTGKSIVRTGGKAIVSGTIRQATTQAPKPKSLLKSVVDEQLCKMGKIAPPDSKIAGVKSAMPQHGSIVKYKNLPKSNGEWSGTPGDSLWKPEKSFIPQKLNPEGKSMGAILAENNKSSGILFRNGEIDLSSVAKGTVQIEGFSLDRAKNFAKADIEYAKELTKKHIDNRLWTKGDIAEMRKKDRLTWHERSDMRTLDLVPSELHGNITHRGGISTLKSLEAVTKAPGAVE